jgi:tripartite-type tricarboxylate transporter receptor subunit TctC
MLGNYNKGELIRMKKVYLGIVTILIVLFLLLSLSACSGTVSTKESGEGEEFEFKRKIELVVGFGAGSGTDTTSRAIAPVLEKILGVPVVVTNIEGSGGVKGLEYAAKQPADGYTYMITTQSLILADIQELSKTRIMEDFVPVTRLVQSSVLVATREDSQFNTWDEVVEYAKDNPGKLKIGAQTPKGIDALSSRVIFSAFGIDIPFVAFNSGAETKSAVLGGHIEFINADPSEMGDLIEAGEMKGLIVANDERLPMLPDVPCAGDFGHPEVTLGPWRGFVAKKGTPQEALDAMEVAMKKAYESETFQDWLKITGLDQREGYAGQKEFGEIMKEDEAMLRQIFDEYGLY